MTTLLSGCMSLAKIKDHDSINSTFYPQMILWGRNPKENKKEKENVDEKKINSTFYPHMFLWDTQKEAKTKDHESKEGNIDEYGEEYVNPVEETMKTEQSIKDDKRNKSSFHSHIVLYYGV